MSYCQRCFFEVHGYRPQECSEASLTGGAPPSLARRARQHDVAPASASASAPAPEAEARRRGGVDRSRGIIADDESSSQDDSDGSSDGSGAEAATQAQRRADITIGRGRASKPPRRLRVRPRLVASPPRWRRRATSPASSVCSARVCPSVQLDVDSTVVALPFLRRRVIARRAALRAATSGIPADRHSGSDAASVAVTGFVPVPLVTSAAVCNYGSTEWSHGVGRHLTIAAVRCSHCCMQSAAMHCGACDDVYCSTCFDDVHRCGSLMEHEWRALVPMCEFCGVEPARQWCSACSSRLSRCDHALYALKNHPLSRGVTPSRWFLWGVPCDSASSKTHGAAADAGAASVPPCMTHRQSSKHGAGGFCSSACLQHYHDAAVRVGVVEPDDVLVHTVLREPPVLMQWRAVHAASRLRLTSGFGAWPLRPLVVTETLLAAAVQAMAASAAIESLAADVQRYRKLRRTLFATKRNRAAVVIQKVRSRVIIMMCCPHGMYRACVL
jgi:hypothetical protein